MKIILDSRTDTVRIVTTRVRFDEAGDDDSPELPEASDRLVEAPGRDVTQPEMPLPEKPRIHPRFPEIVA